MKINFVMYLKFDVASELVRANSLVLFKFVYIMTIRIRLKPSDDVFRLT